MALAEFVYDSRLFIDMLKGSERPTSFTVRLFQTIFDVLISTFSEEKY